MAMSFVVIIALSNGRAVEGFVSRTEDKADEKDRVTVMNEGRPLPNDYAG